MTTATVYLSTCHNPYINLAFENWLFQNKVAEQPILYLWQNTPCIVIGRAQNPWLECNLPELNKDGIEVIRRQSGGGTVYHDLGNLNYTFLCPNHHYDKKENLYVVIEALRQLKITASISPRNDIVIGGGNQQRKISGCAFRESRDKSFHHGTLLINADTDKLVRYLHHKQDQTIDAKGVTSVRSKVTNLCEINGISNIPSYITALTQSFHEWLKTKNVITHHYTQDDILALPNTQQEISMLQSWEWRYGKTLPFEKTIQINSDQLKLTIKKGKVSAITHSLKSHPNKYDYLLNKNFDYF